MGLRAENKERRRRRILAAARDLIDRDGIETWSMRKVAQAAGVSVTTGVGAAGAGVSVTTGAGVAAAGVSVAAGAGAASVAVTPSFSSPFLMSSGRYDGGSSASL